jgi:hypothetical protein
MAKQRWVIEHKNDEYTSAMADNCRIDGGAIVLTDGDLFNAELVLAIGPGKWVAVFPEPVCDNPEHNHDDD